MKRLGCFLIYALAAAPLSALQGPYPTPPPPPPQGGGGGGFPGIGISISLGKKKPREPKITAPPLEMRDVEMAEYVAGEVLYFINGDEALAATIAKAGKVKIIEITRLDELGMTMVRASIVAPDSVEAAIARLARQPGVISAEPNLNFQVLGGNSRENGVKLNNITLSSKTKISGTIAIIDGVVDIAHPDLANASVVQTIPSGLNNTASSHGTAVAELLVGSGVLGGIARGATLVSYPAFTAVGANSWQSTSAKVITALNLAAGKRPQVLNLSFGSSTSSSAITSALQVLETKGVCVVAAVGNSPTKGVHFPARVSTTFAVTAVNAGKSLYSQASKGPEVDIAAWGVGMTAAVAGGGTAIVSGTSFATAVVSAGLMRMNGCNGGRNPAGARAAVASNASAISGTTANQVGAGLFHLP